MFCIHRGPSVLNANQRIPQALFTPSRHLGGLPEGGRRCLGLSIFALQFQTSTMLCPLLLPSIILLPLRLLPLFVQDFFLLIQLIILFDGVCLLLLVHELIQVPACSLSLRIIDDVHQVHFKLHGFLLLLFPFPHWFHLLFSLLVQHLAFREFAEGCLHVLPLFSQSPPLFSPSLLYSYRLLSTLLLFFLGLLPLRSFRGKEAAHLFSQFLVGKLQLLFCLALRSQHVLGARLQLQGCCKV
mmetsp:Transcript_18220/g.42417  ORF Transcript_18220/g.42417 Transcript_18220/m.42417 type:complete len:241 (+) Transcript_18220:512-1234(+)